MRNSEGAILFYYYSSVPPLLLHITYHGVSLSRCTIIYILKSGALEDTKGSCPPGRWSMGRRAFVYGKGTNTSFAI